MALDYYFESMTVSHLQANMTHHHLRLHLKIGERNHLHLLPLLLLLAVS